MVGDVFSPLPHSLLMRLWGDIASKNWLTAQVQDSAVLVAEDWVVAMVRDYAKQYDPNAIEVRVAGATVVYVHRAQARLLAPRIDAGDTTRATVVTVDRSQSDPKLIIEVSVESAAPNRGRSR